MSHQHPTSLISMKRKAAQKWDSLAKQVRSTHCPIQDWDVGDLAKSLRVRWFLSRGKEPLSTFLPLGGAELFKIPGMGLMKVERLCQLIQKALKRPPSGPLPVGGAAHEQPMVPAADPREALARWEVPLELPVLLTGLPVRIRNYCALHQVEDLGGVLDLWERMGEVQLTAAENLGRKSVGALSDFIHALQRGDLAGASQFLPLQPSGQGLSRNRAVQTCFDALPDKDREALERRWLEGMTLQESAAKSDCTREWVRQASVKFLTGLQEWLGWFLIHDASGPDHYRNADTLARWIGPMASKADSALLAGALRYVMEEE